VKKVNSMMLVVGFVAIVLGATAAQAEKPQSSSAGANGMPPQGGSRPAPLNRGAPNGSGPNGAMSAGGAGMGMTGSMGSGPMQPGYGTSGSESRGPMSTAGGPNGGPNSAPMGGPNGGPMASSSGGPMGTPGPNATAPAGGPNRGGPDQGSARQKPSPTADAKCNSLGKAIGKEVPPKIQACMKKKSNDLKKDCLDELMSQMTEKTKDCPGMIEQIKGQIQAKAPQMGAPEKGGQAGGPGAPGGNPTAGGPGGAPGTSGGPNQPKPAAAAPKVDCAKVVAEAKKAGDGCLNTAAREKRAACWDKVGNDLNSKGAMDACSSTLDPLKKDFMAREKQKYPKQEAALHD
jgi:hypothetical protein